LPDQLERQELQELLVLKEIQLPDQLDHKVHKVIKAQQVQLERQGLQDLLVRHLLFLALLVQRALRVPGLTYLEHIQLLQRSKLHTQQVPLVMRILLLVIFMFGMALLGHLVETFKDQQEVLVHLGQQVQQDLLVQLVLRATQDRVNLHLQQHLQLALY
jgi:p-aminobenzoyl-glutamate transporter AbgT